MNQHRFERLKWWLCEKLGHNLDDGWHYENHHHRNCKWCGRIISKPDEVQS